MENNKLNQSIFNVIHDVEAVKKDTKGHNYMYATLTSVLEALKKPCKDNNIYFLQIPKTDYVSTIETKEKIKINKGKNNIEENIVDVRKAIATVSLITKIVHKDSGETMEYISSCMVEEATDPQKIGSAITYLRRYALVSIFAMEQEDDDGATAKNRENKKEDKKVNNDSSYNSQKDVYEHEVDYNIVPTGDNKGKQWYELNTESICNALNYYYKKNDNNYLIGIKNNISKRYIKANNNLCKGDTIIIFDNNQYNVAYISDDIYTENATIHYFVINDKKIKASYIYNCIWCYVLKTEDREDRLKEKYMKRKIAENKLQDAKDVQNIQVDENEDPYKNANDKNWDNFLIDDSETNTTETVENTNNLNSDDDNGNPFGPDDHIDFGDKK